MVDSLLPPFSVIPLQGYIRKEFKRRRDTYGKTYVKNENYSKMADYRGPMTSWVRVVSNGTFKEKEGFVLHGGFGYKDAYGINNVVNSKPNSSIIGYDRFSNPHIIENNDPLVLQKFRPIPGIEGVEIDIRKDIYRAAFIKWKCYSVAQLDYMTDFMFTPYTSVVLEWGWNTYNPDSLIDISQDGIHAEFEPETLSPKVKGSGLLGAYTNPLLIEEGLEKSHGRYDGMIGHIINFNYTFNPSEMCFNCTTEIASNSRFYFGLSGDKITNKIDKGATEKTKKEFFDKDLKSILEKYTKDRYRGDPATLDKRGYSGLIKGRVFSPSHYTQIVLGGSPTQNAGAKLYISFGLLTDLINTHSAFGPSIRIDISHSKIGAHPNLISCSDNFLIPNALAPYYSPESLADNNIRSSIPKKNQSESPIYSGRVFKDEKDIANILMNTVLSNTSRQDLNVIINHLSENINDAAFPSMDDVYSGDLKNIYLSYDFVSELMKRSKDLRDFLKLICTELNTISIWSLDLYDWQDKAVSIRDAKYLDINNLNALKSKLDIDANDPVIYRFDAFSQDSFLKEFSFNVQLSDTVANMVINQVNADLSSQSEDGGAKDGGAKDDSATLVTNQQYLFPKINDYLLKKIKADQINSKPVDAKAKAEEDKKLLKAKNNKVDDYMKSIDEGTIFLESPQGKEANTPHVSRVRSISRLTLPKDQSSKLMLLLDDSTSSFTNISSMPIPGVKVEFTVLGISGFRMFQVFAVNNLPKPYDTGVLFQITEIKHSINSEGWNTRITACIRPVKSLQTLLI